MICRLCLKNVLCLINIFDELGHELNVAEVIAKHFWFEPKPDDPISNSICEACWHKVTDFNEFYVSVVEAHRLLNERFLFSFDANKAKKISNNTTTNKTKDENAVSTTTTKQNADESLQESTFEQTATKSRCNDATSSNSKPTVASYKPPVAIELEEVVCSNNINENAIVDTTDSNDFDALEETPVLPALKRSKRISRGASNEKKSTPLLDTTIQKRKSTIKAIVTDEATIKRGRGRPKRSSSNTSTFAVKSLKRAVKKELNSAETKTCSLEEDEATEKQSYKEKFREGNERIAQFLSLSCDVCNEKQENFTLLCKHFSRKHCQKGYAICCNKKFYKRVALLDHIENHFNPELFSCKECDKTFADKQCLQNHITIKHLPEESKNFACGFCNRKFGKMYLLEQHRRTHKERNHICDVCQKGFPSLNQLKAHVKVIHNNYGTMCEICSKVIRGRAAFSRHMLQHKGVDLPKVQCPKCGSWHKDKYSLQKHIRRHNVDGTEHVCNECGKVAPNRSALLSHKRFVHKAQRSYECGICNKAFKIQISLKEHMATHTGHALYKCPYCTRTFNSNANMHSHRKKMHPKEFAEARMQRQLLGLTKKDAKDDEENQNEQTTQKQQQDLTIDSSSNAIDLEEEETHILMTTDKYGELVFKVE